MGRKTIFHHTWGSNAGDRRIDMRFVKDTTHAQVWMHVSEGSFVTGYIMNMSYPHKRISGFLNLKDELVFRRMQRNKDRACGM